MHCVKSVVSVKGEQGDKASSSRRSGKQKGSKEDKPVYVDAAPLAALFQVRSALHSQTMFQVNSTCSQVQGPRLRSHVL